MYNGFLKKDEESEFIRMISAKLSLKFLLKQNKGNVWIYSVLQKNSVAELLKHSNVSDRLLTDQIWIMCKKI